MNDTSQYPKLIFGEKFDERTAFETAAKGYYSGVIVEMENGSRYSLFFYDPVRLAQELEVDGVIGEPGMIVIREVTQENMLRAVRYLITQDHFDHLRPVA